jgi:hypothetical protein
MHPLTAPLTPLPPRSSDELLTAYGIGLRAGINKARDYYDEALGLDEYESATYWFAYIGGMQQALDLFEKLRTGEL